MRRDFDFDFDFVVVEGHIVLAASVLRIAPSYPFDYMGQMTARDMVVEVPGGYWD